MNPEQFVQELSKYNFRLTDEQKKQFKLYFKDLLTANEHVNLTRITEEDDVYLKQRLLGLMRIMQVRLNYGRIVYKKP